jgi:hypothetical protein
MQGGVGRAGEKLALTRFSLFSYNKIQVFIIFGVIITYFLDSPFDRSSVYSY